jgi:hypothetical protein
MLDGLHHVWRAAEALAGGDAGLTERLKEARTHLIQSLAPPNQWPPDLLSVARSIERVVREQGGADPLEAKRDGFHGIRSAGDPDPDPHRGDAD